MLPEHLVPPRFHLSPVVQAEETAENDVNFTQGKTTLSDYEADILIISSRRMNVAIWTMSSKAIVQAISAAR